MKKKRFLLVISIMTIIVVAIAVLSTPKIRTNLFVQLYHETIEESLSNGMGVPADDAVLFGYKYMNTWEDEHSMTEFLISASGFGSETKYYGCYYSPDDIPLAFQNYNAELTQCGHDSWKWYGEGDNWGKTMKIMDQWYYFEASF